MGSQGVFLLKFHLIFYFLLIFFFFGIPSSKTCPLLCSANENRWGKVMLERALEGHREEKYDYSMCHTPTCSCHQRALPHKSCVWNQPEEAREEQAASAIRDLALRPNFLENRRAELSSQQKRNPKASPENA